MFIFTPSQFSHAKYIECVLDDASLKRIFATEREREVKPRNVYHVGLPFLLLAP